MARSPRSKKKRQRRDLQRAAASRRGAKGQDEKDVDSATYELITLFSVGLLVFIFWFAMGTERAWDQPEEIYRFFELMAVQFAIYAGVLWWCRRAGWRGRPWRAPLLLFWAALFRLALVPAGAVDGWEGVRDDFKPSGHEPGYWTFLLYDNDVWRYLWDGQVLRTGVNTYRLSPNAIEELADDGDPRFTWFDDEPWGTIHNRIGYADYRTVYPPLAQATFVAASAIVPGSTAVLKLILILFDVGTCWLLFDLARRALGKPDLAVIYAWNPLAIKEIAGSAHVDALAVFSLVLAGWLLERGRERASLLALAAAILVKLTPLLAVPLFLRRIPWRRWWVLPAAGAVAYAPLLTTLPTIVESLKAFSRDWAFNAGFWNWTLAQSHAAGFEGRQVADLVSLMLTAAILAFLTWRPLPGVDGLLTDVGWALGLYVILSPTVMPWYLLWALPLLTLRTEWVWPAVTAASLASYGVYIDGAERQGWLIAEHVLIAIVLLPAFVARIRTRGAP
ncbi:MAG: hypothetical protein AAGM22_00895 [Acidobacteriota bacterium]